MACESVNPLPIVAKAHSLAPPEAAPDTVPKIMG